MSLTGRAVSRFSAFVFAVLVAATFSGFFVASELKSRPPVIELSRVLERFSPNDDGRRETNRISLVVRERDELTVDIVDRDGDRVRRLAEGVEALPYRPVRVEWDGRTDAGAVASDGIYRVRVNLRGQGRAVTIQRAITLDTTPPSPLVRVDAEDRLIGPRGRPVSVRIRGAGSTRTPRLVVWRTDVSPAVPVARLKARGPGATRARWDGRVDGEAAPPGTYLIEAIGTDAAGNRGSSAPSLPELPEEVRGAPGVTVRSLAVQPPVLTRRTGEEIRFLVDSRQAPYRWQVRRLGRSRPLQEGNRRSGDPRLTIDPVRGESGVHLLEVFSEGRRTAVPFAVRSPQRAPLLVVLPTVTWLGADRLDSDFDGLPDTLERREAVPWPRPFQGDGGLPSGFADGVAPQLVTLDRANVPYDVTTDLDLATGAGPRLSAYEGVLLPGPLRWVPRNVARKLRSYVIDGGRLAAVGTDSMLREVTVTRERLVRPTQPASRDPFGTAPAEPRRLARGDGGQAPALELIAEDRELGLFEGSDGILEGFTVIQEAPVPAGGRTKLLTALALPPEEPDGEAASAAADPQPVVSAIELGRGLVIRVGLPQWPQRVGADEEVAQVNSNVIDILRGVEPRVRTLR